MEITNTREGDTLIVAVSGRINTNTAPEFEAALSNLDGVKHLVLDFTDVAYISSAGLRVVLKTRKTMSRQGDLVVRNVKPEIMEVFEMTGFLDFLTIE
jgi:anti-sigma B factor antagonist